MWYVKKLGQWKVKKGNFGELQNCFNLNSSKKTQPYYILTYPDTVRRKEKRELIEYISNLDYSEFI